MESTQVRSNSWSTRNLRMSPDFSRVLIRLLASLCLLLLGSGGKDGGARIPEHRDSRSTRGIATANLSATPATTRLRTGVDTAPLQLVASEANLCGARVQFASAPTRIASPLCSCDCTTGKTGRPPPFQA